MTSKISAALFFCSISLIMACGQTNIEGSGVIETRTLDVEGFDRVEVCCGWQVELTQAGDEGATITGDDNIIADIVAERSGTRLRLKYEDESADYQPSQPIRIAITAEQLRSFIGSQGSTLTSEGLQTDDLELVMRDGGEVTLGALVATSLDVAFSGGSTGSIEDGEVIDQRAELSGGSILRTGDMTSQSAELSLSGASQATVWVTDQLDVEASGGSLVEYYGQPSINRRLSGGSRVESLGEK